MNSNFKNKKSPMKAFLLWFGFSLTLIIMPNFNPIVVWTKNLYLLISLLFLTLIHIYLGTLSINKEDFKIRMCRNFGIDESIISQEELKNHRLLKNLYLKFWFILICIAITTFVLFVQGHNPFGR